MSGQTISDRLLAARHSIAGQGLAKAVCKATTEEVIGPKKKHLDCKYLIWPDIDLGRLSCVFLQFLVYRAAAGDAELMNNIPPFLCETIPIAFSVQT